jgi:hypothetical protein
MSREPKPRECRHEFEIVKREGASIYRKCKLCPHTDVQPRGRQWGDPQRKPARSAR